jgi:hypothetical protein
VQSGMAPGSLALAFLDRQPLLDEISQVDLDGIAVGRRHLTDIPDCHPAAISGQGIERWRGHSCLRGPRFGRQECPPHLHGHGSRSCVGTAACGVHRANGLSLLAPSQMACPFSPPRRLQPRLLDCKRYGGDCWPYTASKSLGCWSLLVSPIGLPSRGRRSTTAPNSLNTLRKVSMFVFQ